MSVLTVKKLKEILENVHDDLEVELWSDSGVDQSDDDSEVVIEDAWVTDDAFIIYANYRDVDEIEGE